MASCRRRAGPTRTPAVDSSSAVGRPRRLIPDGARHAAVRLIDTKTTTIGVVIATYQPIAS